MTNMTREPKPDMREESLADRDNHSSCPQLLSHVFRLAPQFYKRGNVILRSRAELTLLIIQLSC